MKLAEKTTNFRLKSLATQNWNGHARSLPLAVNMSFANFDRKLFELGTQLAKTILQGSKSLVD